MNTWYKIEAKRNIFIRKYYTVFRKVLHEQLKPLIHFLKTEDITLFEDVAEVLIDEEMIKQPLIDLFKKVGYEFIQLTPKLIKRGDDAERFFWEMELERIALEEVGSKIVSITASNKDNILRLVQKTIKHGFSEGQGIEQITRGLLKNLNKEVQGFTRVQARRIAQTEVIQSSNKATWEAGKILDIPVQKQWHVAPVGVSKTERHTLPGAIQKMIVEKNEKFFVDGGSGYVEMDHPGDPAGGAENTINCKCAMSYKTI